MQTSLPHKTRSGRDPGRKHARVAHALLRWFRAHARDLPWRHTRDPYAIWISEVMLQQTQVTTVIPYWQRWMKTFPSLASLARARIDRILKAWEGLGYYSRARNLHAAARIIRRRHHGLIPRRFEDLLALPGVGRYTAGAISSIAFNQPRPVVDGNVARVLGRLYGLKSDPGSAARTERLWRLAGALVQESHRCRQTGRRNCSDLNQALMELGATVCSPRNPDCPACPVSNLCRSRIPGRPVHGFSSRRLRPMLRKRSIAVLVERNGRWLVRQRPANGLNGGLWEFPNADVPLRRHSAAERVRAILGSPARSCRKFMEVRHTITRHRIRLEVYLVKPVRVNARSSNGRYLPLAHLAKLAFPAAHRRIVARLARV